MTERQPSEQLLQIRQSVETNMRTQPLADGVAMEEIDAGGVPVVVLTPSAGYSATLLYMHGGGYRLGSARGFAAYTSHLAAACKVRVVSVDYRLSPEHPFPAALTDCRNAYVWVLGSGSDPHQVVVGGDSAGGGLAAALLVELKMQGIPSPAAAVLLSPWADLRVINDSYDQCAETDQLFSRASATDGAALYLNGHPADDPLVSTVLASWTDQPPLLIQVSELEVLRDDAAQLAKVATDAGVSVQHEVFPGVQHVWQLGYPQDPNAVAAVDQIAAFIAHHTGAPSS